MKNPIVRLAIPIFGGRVFNRQVVAQVGRALKSLFAVGAIIVLVAVVVFEFLVAAEKLSCVYLVISNCCSAHAATSL